MRVSWKWLNDYVNLADSSPEELGERLTSAGLEVEGIEYRNQGVKGVVVGQVVTCVQHPNADRLRVTEVRVAPDSSELMTIVCGADNVTAGIKVPVALPGAELPGGKIGKAKLRGVESNGMLCSAKEIGLETRLLPKSQTEGLFVLPDDAPIGGDIVSYLHLDDVVLDISLTPNRSDCLSLRGLAYEVGAVYNREVRFVETFAANDAGRPPVEVKIDSPQCTRYEAQVLSGIQPMPSPIWMQMRLLAAGVRPINAVVDVTNYVMLEWGQPLHAFDLDEVHNHTIIVRQGQEGETLVTLDGENRALTPDTLVIADPTRAIGIAGVMGGENSEVTQKTTRIVLESAAFAATSVRKTGQRLGLRSEAQQRFEKGIDSAAVAGALARATELMKEVCHAVPEGNKATAETTDWMTGSREIPFSVERANKLLGTDISAPAMADVFHRLGFGATPSATDASVLVVDVPSRRPDITMQADLTEEVGRIYGLDSIPSELPNTAVTLGARNTSQALRKRTRDVLIGAGMMEVFPYTFTSPRLLDDLRLPENSPLRKMIPLLHPLSEERSHLRTHLLPGLLQIAAYNLAHGVARGALFEIGRVYLPDELPLKSQPEEPTLLAMIWFGQSESMFGERQRGYDFYDAKGAIEVWLDACGFSKEARFEAASRPWLHPGRSAEIYLGNKSIGMIGQVHPETAAAFDAGETIYAELSLDAFLEHVEHRFKVQPLPKYPSSQRDLALVVAQDLPAGMLLDTIRAELSESNLRFLEDVRVFDVYMGKGVPEGHKSVALTLSFRADDRTLTDDEVGRAEQLVLDRLRETHGAVRR